MTPNDERAQIRAEAVREAVLWLNNHVGDMLYGPDEPEDDGHTVARANAISFAAKDMERALLRPDPAEASEPLQSAPWPQAPGDHGPPAAAHSEAGTIHEPTVRACIEIVERLSHDAAPPPDKYAESFDDGIRSVCADIHTEMAALLPKPDPAAELVDAYREVMRAFPMSHDARMWTDITGFVRWLIDTGRLTA